MVRTPWFDKNGMKKGAWTAEEDAKLKAYIANHEHWSWRELPEFAGLKRCGKSCRLRWMNYLKPGLKHGSYTMEEDQLIIQLHQQHGNKWAEIALKLPGRSDNDIKNHWHTHLKKRVGFKKPANSPSKMIHTAAAGVNDEMGGDMQIEILESCPLNSSEEEEEEEESDWGLEEMMNSVDLTSTFLSPINQHDYGYDYDYSINANAMLPAAEYDYGEVDQDVLWSEALLVSHNYDVNYYQDNDLDLWFHHTI